MLCPSVLLFYLQLINSYNIFCIYPSQIGSFCANMHHPKFTRFNVTFLLSKLIIWLIVTFHDSGSAFIQVVGKTIYCNDIILRDVAVGICCNSILARTIIPCRFPISCSLL